MSVLSMLQLNNLVEMSNDPDELNAEKQLHREINAALERYARRVIMIRRKRRESQKSEN